MSLDVIVGLKFFFGAGLAFGPKFLALALNRKSLITSLHTYRVGQKMTQIFLYANNFIKYQPIFKIFILSEKEENLQ